MSQISEEQQKIYEAALPLVDCIGENLDRVDGGRVHYRTKAGKTLLNLDQVINAILADDLDWQWTLDPPPEGAWL